MSSAILYLAIVAIWACVLVPRWLHKSHAPARPSGTEEPQHPPGDADPGHDTDPADDANADDYAASEAPESTGPAPAPEPARQDAQLDRAHLLQARRRMLAMLVALTAMVIAFASIGLAHWWLAVPPAAMLGLYLVLLREAGRADAESAHRLARAQARRHARAERAERARRAAAAARSRREAAAAAAAPTAEVIDISARVGDQLYDQYADAAARAVGD